MQSINERFLDHQIAQQVRWIRVANRDVAEMLKILAPLDKQLEKSLRNARLESTFTRARLEALRKQIAGLIETLHEEQLIPGLLNRVSEAAKLSAEIEGSTLRRFLPAGLDVTTPNLGVLQVAATTTPFNGGSANDWAKELKTADVNRTWRTVLGGITSGSTTEQIIASVIGTKPLRYKDGVREVTRRGAATLVRTSINHAASQGRNAVWEENSDIIRGVRWVSTLDTRTSPVCRHNDGRMGPTSTASGKAWTAPDGVETLSPLLARPPAHPNCRSTTVAVTKSFAEMGIDLPDLRPETRASMDGKVPANLTYYEWLARQSDDIQREVLGKTRFDLWKKKGVTPDEFVNDVGEQLSLPALRRRAGLQTPVAQIEPEVLAAMKAAEIPNTPPRSFVPRSRKPGIKSIKPTFQSSNSELPDILKKRVDDALEALGPFMAREVSEVVEVVSVDVQARAFWDSSRAMVKVDLDTQTSVYVHELMHALDTRFSQPPGKRDVAFRGTLQWHTEDVRLNELAARARLEFLKRDSKGEGAFNNGDGPYALGDWAALYEARLYPQDKFFGGVSSEYLTMAAERYFSALVFRKAGLMPLFTGAIDRIRQKQPAMLALLQYLFDEINER